MGGGLPDRAEIQQLFALFSHVFDNGDLENLDLVFTKDAVIDLRSTGREYIGLDVIADFVTALAKGGEAPDHHTVDTVLLPGPPGEEGAARARSRYLAITRDGSVYHGDYLDDLRLTDDGWRIARRVSVPRRSPQGPVRLPDGFLDPWSPDRTR